YVDYLENLLSNTDPGDAGYNKLKKMKKNLEDGMDECLELSTQKPYKNENLESLNETVHSQRIRLEDLFMISV
ncbi:MAG: hypothetical protein WDZ38_06225, partial [Balneolaceae bacterium]